MGGDEAVVTLPTPAATLAFLRAHWRAVAGVVALVVAFLFGLAMRRPGPPRIEYRDRVVTKTEWKDRIVEKTVTIAATEQQKERVTHRHEVIAPDGTHTIDLDTGTGVQTQVNVGQLAAVNITEQGTQAMTRETQVVQTPAPLPRWRVGGLVGLGADGKSFGAEGGLRVVGPLWLGVGGFVGPHPMGFATVGVEW
jgi:hypothetical protein